MLNLSSQHPCVRGGHCGVHNEQSLAIAALSSNLGHFYKQRCDHEQIILQNQITHTSTCHSGYLGMRHVSCNPGGLLGSLVVSVTLVAFKDDLHQSGISRSSRMFHILRWSMQPFHFHLYHDPITTHGRGTHTFTSQTRLPT